MISFPYFYSNDDCIMLEGASKHLAEGSIVPIITLCRMFELDKELLLKKNGV